MTKSTSLPANIYRLRQGEFDVIPGKPLIYWLNEDIRELFKKLDLLSEVGVSKVGINTGHNERFVRWHWELSPADSSANWQPYVSGGPKKRYYGNLFYFLNWSQDEISEYPGSALRAREYQGKEGLTYGLIGSGKPAFRYLPSGYMFSSGGNCIFMDHASDLLALLGILNSSISTYLLKILNPTINLSVGDILRLPIAGLRQHSFNRMVLKSIWLSKYQDCFDETTIDITIPLSWNTGIQNSLNLANRITNLDIQINDEIFALYGISPADRAAIETELAGGPLIEDIGEGLAQEEAEEDVPQSTNTEQRAARWISYALGVVLGRFVPGDVENAAQRAEKSRRALGNAVYYLEDFAIGSLPAPNEDEFNELVGPPDSFAYVDDDGGRHVFTTQVEQSLRALAFEDGIAVLEAGHPSDLVVRVAKALTLMLGERDAAEVVGALGDQPSSVETFLRKFLERDYFTQWHFKWYRKRPVYWPIQSAKRSYGFVLFHERITRDTFYAIQREPYLDTKRNAVALKIGDLQGLLASATGSTRKKLEKDLDDLRKLSTELEEFAKELEAITMGGYHPAPEWIDDGVILRLAPLWKVISIWKTEPKKYWERLEAGDFDWSRIAMNYWPKRVKAKCKTNKSYAIAHGHEEWYEGK
jgi:hypothetical protein